MLRLAMTDDILQLKNLWIQAFGDDPSIDDYFTLSFSQNTVLVWEEDNKIISMLHMIPCEIHCEQQIIKAFYLYALATDQVYQNQGIMGKLIEQAHQMALSMERVATFLVPADGGLSDYYKRFQYESLEHTEKGFRADVIFSENTTLFVQHELEELSEPFNGEEYISICWLDKKKHKLIDWIDGIIPF